MPSLSAAKESARIELALRHAARRAGWGLVTWRTYIAILDYELSLFFH